MHAEPLLCLNRESYLQGSNDDGVLKVAKGLCYEIGLVLGLPALAAALGRAAAAAYFIRDHAPTPNAMSLHSRVINLIPQPRTA